MENLPKLFTKEDNLHLHKFFGTISLVHFIYQFSSLVLFGKMNFNQNSLYLLFIHALLSTTSLIFHISSHRNEKMPIIYPELRLHSIIFAYRSIICFYLSYYEMHFIYKMATCFATMIAADIVTHYTKKGTTIRNMPYSEHMTEKDRKKIIYHYSRSQVGATMLMLGNETTAFVPLLPIQIAAFLMTLVRKNIIKGHMFHVVYAIAIWLNAFSYLSKDVGWMVLHFIGNNIFSYLRFERSANKYIAWGFVFTIYALLSHYKVDVFITDLFPSHFYGQLFIYSMVLSYIYKNIRNHSSLWK